MATTASASLRDSDSRSLQVLLEAFGSRFSLEDIDTAFCQANRNVNKAGEILFAMTEKMPKSDELNVSEAILDPTSRNVPQEVHQEDMKSRVSKPKKYSASVGTVSSVIGKEYVSTRTLANAPRKATKPLKIDAKDIPETEIWSEEMPENSKGNSDRSQTDVEEFLIKMLREGFQVNPSVVHEVLGSCGYDVHKSMEKLLDLSDIKKHNNGGIATGMRPEEKPKKQGSNSCHNVEMQDSALSDAASNLTSPLKGSKVKTDLQREVLEALFSGAQSFEEEAEEIRRVGERRARAVGRPVAKPLVLDEPNHKRVVVVKQLPQTLKEGEDHDGFEALRKAATEYWNVMKEYYKAAVEAFLKGETERSYRLLEEGHSFKQKAREADEKSVAKLVEVKEDSGPTYEEDEVVTLNLQEHQPKEALRVLKHQLTCFSGISYFKYLRIIVGVNTEDTKSSRKRLLVKLLEKESIAWSEEDNGLTMMIQVDKIDPKSLSFAKK